MFGHVRQLLAHRAVGRGRRGALVDRRGPRVGAVEVQSPVAGQRYGEVRLQFDAAGMDFLEVARREEAFGRRQPDNPVVDVRIEPRCRPAQLVAFRLAHGERNPRIVGPAALPAQVGIAARQEIEIVEGGEAEVARDGGLGYDVAPLGEYAVEEKGGDEGRPLRAEQLLAQDDRNAETLDGPPFGRETARKFDASLVVADYRLVALLRNDVFVGASDQMLVGRERSGEKPLAADAVFAVGLPVERVDAAARAGHGHHCAVAHVAPVVVGHPGVDVSRLGGGFPVAAQMVPRHDAAESLLALAVLEPEVRRIVGREHR